MATQAHIIVRGAVQGVGFRMATQREAQSLGLRGCVRNLPTGEKTSSAGTLFGPHSYGHTGWTGTSLWIDPDRDLFVLLLTNRAYDPRVRGSLSKLKEVRGRVADAAARAADALAP